MLATGGTPRRLGGDDGDVIYFRTLADYRRMRALSDEGARFLVVGGGFIGSEIAAALRSQGRDVTMVFPEEGIGWRTFPPALARFVADYYRERGRRTPRRTATFESAGGFDAVVAGLGIVPRTELAENAGLPVDDGIVVDEYGRVEGHEDVFAAGDVARFPIPALGKQRPRRARGSREHARAHCRRERRRRKRALRAPAVLLLRSLRSRLRSRRRPRLAPGDGRAVARAEQEGLVAYVDADVRPRGFLLWNVWGKVDAGPRAHPRGKPIDEETLRGLAG